MTKKQSNEYRVDHKLAKLIVCLFNTALFLIVFEVNHALIFLVINITYFFGVNTVVGRC